MTVITTAITSGPYTGNGVADTFAFGFRAKTISQIDVYETDTLGAITKLTPTTDFTVPVLGNPTGGDVVRVAGPLPTGYTWYIRANYIESQETSFASQGAFFPAVHEDAFDKITLILQQLTDVDSRALRVADTDFTVDPTKQFIPAIADRANKGLGFDANGIPMAIPIITQAMLDAVTSAATNAAASETNAAASETNAAASATNAAASATNAAASATNAAASATNAAANKDAASGYESLMPAGKQSLTPTHGLVASNGKAVSLPTDYALQTWSDALTSGLYAVTLTIAQNGLPAGTWYIEVLRRNVDASGSQYRFIRATEILGVGNNIYQSKDHNGAWTPFVKIATESSQNNFTARQTWQFGANIASASTVTLGTDGNAFHLTGTTTISDFTAITGSGPFFIVTDGILTFTNATGVLETNTGADITSAAGDRFRLDQDSDGTTWLLTQLGAGGSSGGKLGQIVQTVDTTVKSTASTTMVTTGISATLPSLASTSSKVRIHAEFTVGRSVGGGHAAFTIHGNTGDLVPSGAAEMRRSITQSFNDLQTVSIDFLHSPASTASQTYTLYFSDPSASGTVYLNRRGGDTSGSNMTIITLEEILA